LNRAEMKIDDVMRALERAGSEQTRKTYRRHGAQDPMFGVPYSVLYPLQKKIGADQQLAEALWATGNYDARVLATLVADAAAITGATLDRWRRDSDHRAIVMAFAAVAARSAAGLQRAQRWIDGSSEFEQAAGWGTLAGLANARAVADDVFASLLGRIERTIHQLPNFARYLANNCLIAIATRPALAADAMRVAKAVGRVDVDHGDTECKTPVATEYITKMAARAVAKAKGKPKATPRSAGAKPATRAATGKRPAPKRSAAKRGAPKRPAARA
jgi:hypothetical protein